MNIKELMVSADKLKNALLQREFIRHGEVSFAGKLGTMADHAVKMGVVLYFDAEGNPEGIAADWVDASRNGYSEEDVVKFCAALGRLVRLFRE